MTANTPKNNLEFDTKYLLHFKFLHDCAQVMLDSYDDDIRKKAEEKIKLFKDCMMDLLGI